MFVTATDKQIQLLQHTLGLDAHRRVPHRDYFVAGEGHHDMADLQALESLGLMVRGRTPAFCDKNDVVFHTTEGGRAAALERLPPEPTPAKRSRYDDFLAYDSDLSFGEYLCGNKLPAYERSYWTLERQWRMVRRERDGADIAGDWCSTKKEAKATYKRALAAHASSRSRLLAVQRPAAAL